MDLAPFAAIDPCGYPGMSVTQTTDLGLEFSVETAGKRLATLLLNKLENA